MNKNKEKFVPVDPSPAQACDNVENLTAIDNHLNVPTTTNNLESTMSLRSAEPLAPHRRTPVKDQIPKHQIFDHTQVAAMDASRLKLDISKSIESETSSVEIITVRKPSCWSVASLPEAPPTEWNCATANIDRPATTSLPVYYFPKPEHNTERENVSKPFSPQQTKLNSQATTSTSKPPKPHEMKGSPRSAAPGEDEVQAAARVASRDDGRAADSLHRLQQLQHDTQLDVEQASKVKSIQEELLARTVQASSGVQLEGNRLKASSPTRDISQARRPDLKETSIDPSAVSLQANINQLSTPLEKQSGEAPHLKVQSIMHGPDNKDKPLLPHLRSSASPITTTATKATAHDKDIEPGKQRISKIQRIKIPPHRQGLSAATTRATQGPSSGGIPSPMSQTKDDSNRRTIDIDEEIAATQPVLDIDEEIVAGLNAETFGAFPVARPTNHIVQETHEQVLYVPPQARASSSRVKASVAETKSNITDKNAKSQAGQRGDGNHSTNTRSNGFELHAGALQDVSGKRKNANLASAPKKGAVPNGAESSVKKGKKPAREVESVDYTPGLISWDGKMNPPPVGDEWDRRQPFNARSNERLSVIEAWREEHAADPEENKRIIVNTASADFQTGEGLAGGDVNVLSPINKMDHETHTPNDDFTQARRHRNAAEAMEDYKAKIAAKPKTVSSGIEGMTKEEKRALRRALMEEERTRVIPPNPHAPTANVYLRPAEFRDMSQVMNIYNHDVRKTSFVHHLDAVDELYWYVYSLSESAPNPDHFLICKNCSGSKGLLKPVRIASLLSVLFRRSNTNPRYYRRSRLQEAEDERNPFVVAIHMGEKSCRSQGDIIRKKQENVVGFAVATDFGSKQTVYHSSVELEIMVHQDFYHQGIGRTLLDRILAALSPDYNLLECAPFLYTNNLCHWVGGGSRQAKAIMVNVLFYNGKEDTVNWGKQWLSKYGFEHIGTLPHVGFKEGKL